MRYYAGCSSVIRRYNGTLESPAFGVTEYPPNQVNVIFFMRVLFDSAVIYILSVPKCTANLY